MILNSWFESLLKYKCNILDFLGGSGNRASFLFFFFLIWVLFIFFDFLIYKAILLIFFFLIIYLFIFGCVGSSFRARAFSSCGKREPLFIAVRGPLTVAASPVAEHRLQTRRLSSCGSRAQPLRGMWDPPRPGPEPVSPALAGRLSTTAPPGKPSPSYFYIRWAI